MDRIATYLDEEEVDEQVSTLKKGRTPPSDDDDDDKGLGLLNGSFKWNEVEEKKDDKTKDKTKDANGRKFWSWSRKSRSQSQGPSDDAATAVDSQSTTGSVSNGNRFELGDITEGQGMEDEGWNQLECVGSPVYTRVDLTMNDSEVFDCMTSVCGLEVCRSVTTRG